MDICQYQFVFFGTRELGAIVLEKLVQANLKPVLVVTTPDMPVGRKQILTPPPVKVFAAQYNLLVFQPPNLTKNAYVQTIRQMDADLFVLAAYGNILPKKILDIPVHGALNVHPSLLPKYRGPSPERGALLNGEKKTGVTVIRMDEQVDHGPIVAQREFIIPKDMRHEELHAALGELGGELLVETIPGWLEGTIVPKEQDHSKATYTKKLTKQDGRIDWKKPAEYIERQVRALSPWPGTFAKIKIQSPKSKITGQSLKILKAEVIKNMQGEPGRTFLAQGEKLGVYTGRDALLLEELQLEGGKPMNSREFLLGHKEIISTTLQ